MKVSSLIAACGLCVCLSGSLVAQTEQPSTSRPSATPTSPTNSSNAASMNDQLALLKKMEGQWKVDVSVDTSMWNPHLFKNGKKGMNPSEAYPKDASNPSDTAKPTNPINPVNPTNQTNPNDSNNPSRNQDAGGRDSNGMRTFTAYSTSKLIMGDKVLQQTTVMPDLKSRMESDEGRTDKDSSRSQSKGMGDDMFKGLSLLSFDENAKTYSMVFLSNCESEIQLRSGTFQATPNQLVFHGSHGHSQHVNGQAISTPVPNSSTPADRSNPATPTSSTPSSRYADNKGHMSALMTCQVVVDVISPDEHRVTMYASEVTPITPGHNPNRGTVDSSPPDSAAPGTTKRSDPNGPDGNRTNDQNPNTTNPSRNLGTQDKSGWPNSTDQAAQGIGTGKVLYRATFRRATGDDMVKARDMTLLTDVSSPSEK